MARDENILSYALRVLISLLLNFTIGLFGAVIGFMWSLYGLIRTYQTSLIMAWTYFLFASLAAIAFAASWLIGLYLAAAGTVYVGVKALASNGRIEFGRHGAGAGMGSPRRMQYRS